MRKSVLVLLTALLATSTCHAAVIYTLDIFFPIAGVHTLSWTDLRGSIFDVTTSEGPIVVASSGGLLANFISPTEFRVLFNLATQSDHRLGSAGTLANPGFIFAVPPGATGPFSPVSGSGIHCGPPAGPTSCPPNSISEFTSSASLSIAQVSPSSLDVVASSTATKYDALNDGLLVIRYLFGLTGTSLTTGALGSTATRTDPAALKTYLDSVRPLLDIDNDGTADAQTDGLLILRYMFGLRGSALISGAVDPLATRTTAPAIEAYLQKLMP